ncbi:MAG: Hsp20/alpha crystallin family protein [Pseudomonadota bacterium]
MTDTRDDQTDASDADKTAGSSAGAETSGAGGSGADTLTGQAAVDEIGQRLSGLFDSVQTAAQGVAGGLAGALHTLAGELEKRARDGDAVAKGGVTASWGVRARPIRPDQDDASGANDFELKDRGESVAQGPAPERVREAVLDVYDEADAWVAVVELPGVAPDDVVLRAEGPMLAIETAGARKFRGEARLPADIDEDAVRERAETRLINGILEIRIPRRADAQRPPAYDQRF